ncbi:hypothetical protein [Arthrobacter koreensis]|uniref:hypothetical protein n=1 Tax=Arthrobacter koreensis TaxID=199136 RepID=UPI002DB58675|nr:hypothetical protein [Arthrobacter koreensis]MEB7505928.1 hypothetical protein [Arthrobacter koreensis]
MSKAKNALAAGALVLALGASAAGISVLGRSEPGGPEPYRTLIPAPSPTVSVPAESGPPVQDYVAVPAPTADPVSPAPVRESAPAREPAPDTGAAPTQDPAAEAPGAGTSAAPESGAQENGAEPDAAPAANAEQRALASRTAWDAAERNRVAAALAAADDYTAAHPATAEAAVYASVRADLACGSFEDSTTLVTRALQSAGYTFTGCGPQDILSWFRGHPGYGTVMTDAGSARPGSLVIARGPEGNAVIGVYLSDGLAVFGGDAVAASGTGNSPPASALIAPADLFRSALLPAADTVKATPAYVRPAPFA